MEIIQPLKNFGLSEKESKVYLASLEIGNSMASDLSLKSKLPRTLVYDILERLIELGLISYSIKYGKKYFLAANPTELLRIIKEKERSIKEIIPELKILQKTEGQKRPLVEIYEGIDGMKTVMNKILNSKAKEFYAYGSSRSSYEVMQAFMNDWHKQRIKKKIVMRILYNNTKQARERVREFSNTLKYSKYKFMPIELESPTATVIFNNKVVLQSWTKEPFAVIIESNEMAINQIKYFEELWKIAKR